MKISQINVNYGFGSTGIIVRDLQSICKENGMECEVVYSQSHGKSVDTYHMGNAFSNKLHALLSRISGKQGYFSCISTWLLLRHYDSYKPDIIHLHNLHSCYISLPMLLKYAARKSIAVVITLHDCWFYTGGCCHYTINNCFRWKDTCGNCPARKSVNALLLDGTREMLADRYRLFSSIKKLTAVGVSQWITDEARKSVFKHTNCITIHNGIDTQFFHPVGKDELNRFDRSKKLFSLKEQRPDTILILCPANKWFLDINKETFDYFASRLTDDMRMVFIGDGCDVSQLTDKMINIGFVSSREEIRAIYSACDVMVNCTREESLSLLNVEVQACGTPVITYSNTGVKETVNGQCGFAVKNGCPEDAWNTMIKTLENGKSAYSTECQAWAVQEFDKNKNYHQFVKLYKCIVSK